MEKWTKKKEIPFLFPLSFDVSNHFFFFFHSYQFLLVVYFCLFRFYITSFPFTLANNSKLHLPLPPLHGYSHLQVKDKKWRKVRKETVKQSRHQTSQQMRQIDMQTRLIQHAPT